DGNPQPKLYAGREYSLRLEVANPTVAGANISEIQIDLGGSHLEFLPGRSGACTVESKQRAKCPGGTLEPGGVLRHSLQVVTVSPGQQTAKAESRYSVKNYLGGNIAHKPLAATLDILVVDRPWQDPEWFEDPNIQVLPNYPSTILEGGRVRAVLTYVAQPEQEDTSQRRFISKQGHQCQVQRGFIYTH